MNIFVFCAFIFCLKTALAEVTLQPSLTNPAKNAVIFTIKQHLVLSCNATLDGSTTKDQVAIQWKKDNVSVTDVDSLKGRFKLSQEGLQHKLTITSADYSDAGSWSCGALIDGVEGPSSTFFVGSKIAVRIKQANINVVEEESLRVECNVLGNPIPELTWRMLTDSLNGTVDDMDHIKITNFTDDNGLFIPNGALIIEKVTKEDRGDYWCKGTNKYSEEDFQESKTYVRVKDKYAALWPFLGICAEVIVLCAIIVIYEKKHNKAELDESDTDQSPDQKNTPDHGKDANLRHRQ